MLAANYHCLAVENKVYCSSYLYVYSLVLGAAVSDPGASEGCSGSVGLSRPHLGIGAHGDPSAPLLQGSERLCFEHLTSSKSFCSKVVLVVFWAY